MAPWPEKISPYEHAEQLAHPKDFRRMLWVAGIYATAIFLFMLILTRPDESVGVYIFTILLLPFLFGLLMFTFLYLADLLKVKRPSWMSTALFIIAISALTVLFYVFIYFLISLSAGRTDEGLGYAFGFILLVLFTVPAWVAAVLGFVLPGKQE